MSRWSRLIPGIGFAVLLAACGSAGSDTPMSPITPRFDGGGVIVNGNAVGSGGSGGSTQSTTTHGSTTTATASSDSTGTGGATGGVIVNGN